MQWSIADGQEHIPKDDPETCHHKFDLPRRGWPPCFGTPKVINFTETWVTFHLSRILHVTGCISVHNSDPPGETQSWAFRSGAECSADWATVIPVFSMRYVYIIIFY